MIIVNGGDAIVSVVSMSHDESIFYVFTKRGMIYRVFVSDLDYTHTTQEIQRKGTKK